MNEQWHELSEDVIAKFNEILETKAFAISFKIDFIGNTKQKGLITMKKIPANYAAKLEADLQVIINEDLYDKYNDDEAISILFEQEINKIVPNMETGAIKLSKPDLITFSGLVNKYGVEKICRANEVDTISSKQEEADLL
jgi:hypothetical protein